MSILGIVLLCVWIVSFAITTNMERHNGRTYEDYGFDDPVAYDMYSFIIAPIILLLAIVCCSIWNLKHKEKHNKA